MHVFIVYYVSIQFNIQNVFSYLNQGVDLFFFFVCLNPIASQIN